MQVKIDRGAGIAVWRQIAEWLKAEIAQGTFVTGAKLPTESDIAARFQVNRHTVRRAIAALTGEGLLRADQGRGTFVASTPMNYPIGARTRFSEIVSGQDKTPSGRMIGTGVEDADALIAGQLQMQVGAPLLRIETLRVVDGTPVLVGTSWFEQARFPGLVAAYAETGSFTEALRLCGVEDYSRRETRVSAELVDSQDIALLEIAAGQPVLIVESVNVDPQDRPVQYTRTRMAADRIQLVVES
ncbi:phosphonate metabolism transcriptional regulator PhnF [Roseibium sp. H3510]|uniref:Phosphonate metabolism transcriptional regulator PhnF n=2 Tax=Roseibium algae TaxID=3123038 RepID=A0ABU8TQC1_9HYPH